MSQINHTHTQEFRVHATDYPFPTADGPTSLPSIDDHAAAAQIVRENERRNHWTSVLCASVFVIATAVLIGSWIWQLGVAWIAVCAFLGWAALTDFETDDGN